MWKWLRRVLRGHGAALALICAGTACLGLGSVLLALIMRQVVDQALAGTPGFAAWGAGLIGLALLLVLLQLGVRGLSGRTRDLLRMALRRDLLHTLLTRRQAELSHYHSGELVSRLGGDVGVVCDKGLSLAPDLLGRCVRLAGGFGALFLLDRGLAAALLAAAAVLALAAGLFRGPLKHLSREVRAADGHVRAGLQESLENRAVIQGLSAEEEILRRAEDRLGRDLNARRKLRRLSLAAGGGLNAVSQAGYCLVLIWGMASVAAGRLSFGTVTAVLQLLSQLRAPVVGLSGTMAQLAAVAASAERLMELEDLPAQEAGPRVPPQARLRAVVFQDVTFQYPGDRLPVLEHVSLRLDAGDWLCLTGISGIGKSTACRLALGLYRPQSGRVYVETDRGDFPCGPGTRRFFSYVPQDHILFSGTIRENLLLAAPEAEDPALLAALEQAGAGFVSDLPQGLDTPLEERGGGLSEGQGQRVALARALLTGAPVLLLDECTSALDAATERDVLKRLRRSGWTALAVTHRPEGMPPGVRHITLEEPK